MTPRPIELITLDLDETLWPCLAPIHRAEEALHVWLGQRAPRLARAMTPEEMRAHRRELVARRPAIAHDVTVIRRTSLELLLHDFGHDPALAMEAMELFLEHRNQVEPFPDVIPTLRALGVEYKLVSVTNGNADPERTPLRGLFHLSLTAGEVGAARPDPALFQAALDWAGLAPAQALHIGDHPLYDIQAARAHGLRALWLNRQGLAWPEELEPPLGEIADLHGLLDWLAKAQGGRPAHLAETVVSEVTPDERRRVSALTPRQTDVLREGHGRG